MSASPEDAMLDDIIDMDKSEEMEALRVERQRTESTTVRNHIAGIPAFELMTTSQIVTVDRYVRHRFDLSSDQFVINRYGLPFIPLPSPRRVNNSSRYRALPREVVDSAIAVHPIYWTSADVLGDVPTSDGAYAQEWSIRMFSFLLLCGLLNENYTYRNYLAVHDRNILDAEGNITVEDSKMLRTYIDGLGAATDFDDIPYLDFDSVVVNPADRGFETKREVYEDFADKMVAKCQAVLDNESRRMYENLSAVLEESDKFIFRDSGEGSLVTSYDERGSHWDDHYTRTQSEIHDDFEQLLHDQGYSQLLESKLRTYTNDVERDVVYMDNLSSSLIGPILASGKTLSEESLAALQAYNRMAVDTAAKRQRYEVSVRDVMLSVNTTVDFAEKYRSEEEVEEQKRSPIRKLEEYLAERSDAYHDAWKRLFLCRANYDRACDGAELFDSFESAQWSIQTSSDED